MAFVAEASKVAAVPDNVAPLEGMRTLVVGGAELKSYVVVAPPAPSVPIEIASTLPVMAGQALPTSAPTPIVVALG